MYESKAVTVSLSKFLLVETSLCIYQVRTERKVGHHCEIKVQGPCENEYEKYSLNSGQCSFLVDEDFCAVKLHDDMDENVVKSTCGGVTLEFNIWKDRKIRIQNLTGEKFPFEVCLVGTL